MGIATSLPSKVSQPRACQLLNDLDPRSCSSIPKAAPPIAAECSSLMALVMVYGGARRLLRCWRGLAYETGAAPWEGPYSLAKKGWLVA